MGIDGIGLLGDTWNVRFVDGSFDSLFGGFSGLDFITQGDSLTASYALLNAYNHIDLAIYTESPELTNGISSPSQGIFYTPYLLLEGNVHITRFFNSSGAGAAADDTSSSAPFSILTTTTNVADMVYADWHIAPVPVPAAVWLMGSGLLGLAGYSRKRSKISKTIF